MSLRFIAFYMEDYRRKTNYLSTLEHGAYFLLLQECWTFGKIPIEPAKRAAIVKMTLKEWNKIAPTINQFFREDGTNKRASEEIEKAEVISLKRSQAAREAGRASGRSRLLASSRKLKYEPNVQREVHRHVQPYVQPDVRQTLNPTLSNCQPTLESKITTTSSGTARESKQDGSLATALDDSALREPKEERKQESTSEIRKRPDQVSGAELAAIYAKRRAPA